MDQDLSICETQLTYIEPLALQLYQAFFSLISYVLPLYNIPKQSQVVH